MIRCGFCFALAMTASQQCVRTVDEKGATCNFCCLKCCGFGHIFAFPWVNQQYTVDQWASGQQAYEGGLCHISEDSCMSLLEAHSCAADAGCICVERRHAVQA